jgi:uncharacterized protein (TIGR03437 family)
VAGEIIPVAQEAFVTLRVTPPTLQLSSVEGKFPDRVAFQIEPIEEEVEWSASARLLNGDVWRFRATPGGGVATRTEPSTVVLELIPSFAAPLPGLVYEAILTVRDTLEGPAVEVPLILTVSPRTGNLELSQSAFVFRASEGGGEPPPQTLFLTNSGSGSLSWTIPIGSIQSAPWLTLSSLSGSATTGSAEPASTTLSVNPAGLAPGLYQTLMEVASPGSASHPKWVNVTLHVVPAATNPIPALSPNGMVFIAEQGGAAPSAQKLYVNNQGARDLRFEFSPVTLEGGGWLRVSQTSGAAGSGSANVDVTANPAGLAAGVYSGRVEAEFNFGAASDVPVLLVVVPPGQRTFSGSTECNAQSVALVPVSLGSNHTMSVTFPQPLVVRLVDNCGAGVNNAVVLAGAEGNQILLRAVGRGVYSGTWTPQLIAGFSRVIFTVLHGTYGIFDRTLVVSSSEAPGSPSLPSIASDGIVDAAGFSQRLPLVPGGIISIFGSNFASSEFVAGQLPLDRELGGVKVRIGNEDAPLFYVGPGQINAQVPFNVVPGSTVSIVVDTGGRFSAPQNLLIAAVQPNIFQEDGIAFATDRESRRITAENPARLNEPLQIFATGLGLVDQQTSSGAPAPGSSTVLNPVRVKIGGVDAPVSYQGLAPGFVGLYQINVFVPGLVRPGDEVTIVFEQNGIPSNADFPVAIPVRNP